MKQRFVRQTDGSEVAATRIPRLKVEYQIARPLFVRVVGEYVSSAAGRAASTTGARASRCS